jgi:energy-coupling factor transport system ATP-binding protein
MMPVAAGGARVGILAGGEPLLGEVPEPQIVGRTGSGKSTLLRSLNGLVPHFSGGTLHGRVLVDGRDTRTHRPRDLADIVGYVGQDPVAGFVTDSVEDELVAEEGVELGLDPDLALFAARDELEEGEELPG